MTPPFTVAATTDQNACTTTIVVTGAGGDTASATISASDHVDYQAAALFAAALQTALNNALPSAATGTLVAGAKDIALAQLVGDKLGVALVLAHGTPGVLSVKRKDAATVTVQSWLAAIVAPDTLVAGSKSVAIASAAADRLGVRVVTPHGTPGARYSVLRTGAATALVTSHTDPVTATDTLVAGSKSVAVASLVGDRLVARVVTPHGTAGDRYSVLRTGAANATVTSHKDPVTAPGVNVAGTVDIALANLVGDRLSAIETAAGGGAAAWFGVFRKDAATVTVRGYDGANVFAVTNTSTVKVINNGPDVSLDVADIAIDNMGPLVSLDIADIEVGDYGPVTNTDTSDVKVYGLGP